MKNRLFRKTLGVIFSLVLLLFCSAGYAAENIDPDNDGFQYAYGENVGWLNTEPLGDGGPGVEVTNTVLTGYMWGENIGWINLSPTEGGVVNDAGSLSGYAWGENVGWISFSCENTDSCITADYGVTIDPATGEFSGFAWGKNIGWINFAPNGVAIKTSWSTVPRCEGDFDSDGDVDGSDLAVFAADFGRTNCSDNCEGDFDDDGDVDGSDLAVFAADFGRTNCPTHE